MPRISSSPFADPSLWTAFTDERSSLRLDLFHCPTDNCNNHLLAICGTRDQGRRWTHYSVDIPLSILLIPPQCYDAQPLSCQSALLGTASEGNGPLRACLRRCGYCVIIWNLSWHSENRIQDLGCLHCLQHNPVGTFISLIPGNAWSVS
jgi:hypothetical protein